MDWVNFFSALLTPVNAIMLLHIAYQQYRINKQRLQLDERRFKHEVYERRLAVFRGLMEFISTIEREAYVTGADLANLVKATAEKEFLFDADICDWLEELYRKSVRNWTNSLRLNDTQTPLTKGPERDKVVDENTEFLKWLREQIPLVRDKFAKHLKLTP